MKKALLLPRPVRIVTHSSKVLRIAAKHGWLPGARYTNLRDVRDCGRVGLIDIQWRNYSFAAHLHAVRITKPLLTVAQDVLNAAQLDAVLAEAEALAQYCTHVIIVPKDPRLRHVINREIPEKFLLGFSVPTRYGASCIEPHYFRRPVHLLGGRPDVQRHLAAQMEVVSFDCNRFTLDAAFGDYFDGGVFKPHPLGGYERCLNDSISNINRLWESYEPATRKDSGPEIPQAGWKVTAPGASHRNWGRSKKPANPDCPRTSRTGGHFP